MTRHADFVHLHVHSQYSLLDGGNRLGPLLERAAALRMPAMALTDHGNMFGAVAFYREAIRAGVKPIIGCEVYVAPGSRMDRTGGNAAMDGVHHLTLLARTTPGYRNLIKLVSAGYLEGFHYRPRIDMPLLAEHADGLIGLSGCLQGEISQLILRGQIERAAECALRLQEVFGHGNLYLEVQDHGMPEQREVKAGLVHLSEELGLPLVATNDCHYLHRDDAEAHEALLGIQTGKTFSNPKRLRLQTDQFYVKSPEEMKNLFAEHPEAIENTIAVAERCNVDLDFSQVHLPSYEPPLGHTLDSYLAEIVHDGLECRLQSMGKDTRRDAKYRNRVDQELKTIAQMGYSGYFLIVWDFIRHARGRGIPVGPGRGSAAGSLVAYALRITDLDPIRYGLLFERFLNPERITLPDIDVDFCQERRDEVIAYVSEKYGEENVAQIITFGTMLAKGVIRDVGRFYDMPYGETDRIAKLVPNRLNITLDEALQAEARLQELAETDPQVSKLLSTARKLEGLTRHASTHAAGVVISPKPLTEFVPLARGANGEVVTQYDMNGIEALGLLKMDFLGLGTLTVIKRTQELVGQSMGRQIETDDIPLDDPKTYQLLSEARTLGVFQLESAGLREILGKLKPAVFDDIVALVALYRPGPLGSGMVEDFINRRHGRTPIDCELPQLEEILKETYGVILYQEQVMQIASALAGFSMGRADLLRRAMGKKDREVMAQQREKFLAGATQRGIDPRKAERIFELMEYFAGYGFNKSHSAAYALVAYWTAYLKANYPVQFMAALLTSVKENTDKVIKYMRECSELGIAVLPPDINESTKDFTVAGDKIRFGLAGIKNVGVGAVETILHACETDGPFASFADLCQRVDLRAVNRRVLESLIKAGAFDALGQHRAALLHVLDSTLEAAQRRQAERDSAQINLLGSIEESNSAPTHADAEAVQQWPEHVRLNYEKEALGFYFTGHPLTKYASEIGRLTNCSTQTLPDKRDDELVRICGMIHHHRQTTTKKGERMGFLNLQDEAGFADIIAFPEVFRKSYFLLDSEEPVLVEGRADAGEDGVKVLAERIVPLKEAAGKLASHVRIRIALERASEETLRDIHDIIKSHLGSCRLLIHLVESDGSEVMIGASDEFCVCPTPEFVTEVEELVGNQSVHLEW